MSLFLVTLLALLHTFFQICDMSVDDESLDNSLLIFENVLKSQYTQSILHRLRK